MKNKNNSWKTIFKESFEGTALSSKWCPVYGDIKLADKRLLCLPQKEGCVELNLTIGSIDARFVMVEYECYTHNESPSDFSVYFQGPKDESCSFEFGTYDNSMSRLTTPGDGTLDERYDMFIIPRKKYCLRAQKTGREISLAVNGRIILRGEMQEDFVVERIFFRFWCKAYLSNIKLFKKTERLLQDKRQPSLKILRQIMEGRKKLLTKGEEILKKENEHKEMPNWAKVSTDKRLINQGERITFSFDCSSYFEPSSTVYIYPRYLETDFRNEEKYQLKWQKGEDPCLKGKIQYKAVFSYTPKLKGNFLMKWESGLRDRYERYTRYFAVIDNTYSVCNFWIGSHSKYRNDSLFHKYYLPGDYADILLSETAREYVTKYGDDIVEYNAQGYFGYAHGTGNPNLYAISPTAQMTILKTFSEIWPKVGLGQFKTFGSYTIGNNTIAVARDMGVTAVTSLASNHMGIDGIDPQKYWAIANLGMPLRAYFISDEDFRKPGPRGKRPVVGSPMAVYHPIFYHEYNGWYVPGCANNSFRLGRKSFSGNPLVNKVSMSRCYDIIDNLLGNNYQKTPFFFVQGIENFVGHLQWHRADMLAVEYLVKKARETNLVFARAIDIAEYYIRQYKETPETAMYLIDFWGGVTYAHKPVRYPDFIQIEGPQFYTVIRENESIPYYLYDYSRKWNYEAWPKSNERLASHTITLTSPLNFADPEVKFKVKPLEVDTRGIKVEKEETRRGRRSDYIFNIYSPHRQNNFPIGVWNIPLKFQARKELIVSSGKTRFICVRDPFTQNFHGVLVGNLKKGKNKFSLSIKGQYRKPKSIKIDIKGKVQGYTIERDGKYMAYLWPTNLERQKLVIGVPANKKKKVKVITIPFGEELKIMGGKITILFGPERNWVRVIGLTKKEIMEHGEVE